MRLSFVARAVIFALLVGGPAAAQSPEPLFLDVDTPTAARALLNAPARSERVADREIVGMRLERLLDRAGDRVLLNVGGESWVARYDRLDTDLMGYRSWVGRIEGIEHSHVSFAERNGVVSGLINAVSERYQVRTITPGTYALERVEMSGNGGELEPLIGSAPETAAISDTPSPQFASDDRGTIDVLFLYTARARSKIGGTPQMQALVAQIISDSNTIFGRSGITTRVRLVGSQEFALTEAANMSTDLMSVTNSGVARGLRDEFRADLVQLLEDTPDQGSCGVAWLLTSLGSSNFNAYSVADIDCVSQYTPTHEMGHNMGSHHAPEDHASFALYAYSFGYKDPARGFRTVMAYSCSGVSCPRVPNMSNPSVVHSGAVTGSASQNNALSINNAAQTVANFRQAATMTPPAVPTGLRSQVNANVVTLSWNPVTSDPMAAPDAATSYVLHVGSASGLSNLFSQNVGNVTSLTGVLPGGAYYWRVTAANGAGQSAPSAEASFTVGACAPPGAPQNFTFSIAGRTVTLTWAAPATGGSSVTYVIEAGSSTGLANLFNGTVGTATVITVTAPPGTYFVRVRAQGACGLGVTSQERVIVVP